MNITSLKTSAIRAGSRGLLQISKHSPELLVGAGVVGAIGAAVLAARATLKLESKVDEAQLAIEDVKNNPDIYENQGRALARVYTRNALKITKLYLPAGALMGLSVFAILSAHGIMRRRNVALMAAYNMLDNTFRNYRERVGEEFGAEKELELFTQHTGETAKDENGKDLPIDHITASDISPYARFFDKLNPHWKPTAIYNMAFLKAQEQYMNDMLYARGHVLLNDVYDALGIDRTSAGAIVGWVLNGDGDQKVDFGIVDFANSDLGETRRRFVNGEEHSILLDFNVDGLIYDKI